MCVALPVRVVELGDGPMPMGRVARGDQPVCFAYLPEVRVGDWVLVQNGFAIEVLDEESAQASFAAFAELVATGR